MDITVTLTDDQVEKLINNPKLRFAAKIAAIGPDASKIMDAFKNRSTEEPDVNKIVNDLVLGFVNSGDKFAEMKARIGAIRGKVKDGKSLLGK
jgi:hypothetical protein